MATALTTKFLLSLGYSLTVIGTTNKMAGLAGTVFGAFLGGSLIYKMGLKRALWIFGIIQAPVGLMFALLARLAGHTDTIPLFGLSIEMKQIWLVLIVATDNFMMGLGTAALTGFMMNFVSKQFTGAQYAILTSVMAVGRVILAGQAGVLVEKMGWDLFFFSTVPLVIPGLLLLFQYDRWQTHAAKSDRISAGNWALIALFMSSLFALCAQPILEWQKLPEVAKQVEFSGSIGLLLVVAIGVIRPHLPKGMVRRLRAAVF